MAEVIGCRMGRVGWARLRVDRKALDAMAAADAENVPDCAVPAVFSVEWLDGGRRRTVRLTDLLSAVRLYKAVLAEMAETGRNR